MNIKQNLPQYINFTNIGMAIAAAQLIASKLGRQIDPNLDFENLTKCGCKVTDTCIEITKMSVSRKRDEHIDGFPLIETLSELRDLLNKPPTPPIKIGDYTAELKPEGIQVGCT